jgi:propionate CoA-transferase
VNADAVIDMNQQFDFYDGGGLDLACLGLAQCNERGDINVSKFGPKLAGAGGFINITQNSGIVIFVGTFTAGGLDVAVQDGKLVIRKEGKAKKFIRKIEQVTFSGAYAAKSGQRVLYVTERCVFKLGVSGLELIEVAPGIDVQKDILAQMEFAPVVANPLPMDERIFRDEPMKLKDTLLSISLVDRMLYDPKKETAFYNFQGLTIRTKADVENVRNAAENLVRPIGKKIAAVVNYDDFQIDEAVVDDYAAMVKYLTDRYYTTVSRYTTSAFMRLKLGEALEHRGVSSHIFESQREALEATKPWTSPVAA